MKEAILKGRRLERCSIGDKFRRKKQLWVITDIWDDKNPNVLCVNVVTGVTEWMALDTVVELYD